MMGFGNMMGWGGGFSFWGFLIWLVILVDLVLLGAWLWKQIGKK